MYKIVNVFIALLLGSGVGADAQQAQEASIMAAAATYFSTALNDSSVVVDPRIAARAHREAAGTFEGDWNAAVLEALQTNLNARAVRQVEVVRCASAHPRSCAIHGADVFIKFGRPAVTGAVATLYVDVVFPTASARTPVATRQHEITLRLVRSKWQVVSDRVVAQS